MVSVHSFSAATPAVAPQRAARVTYFGHDNKAEDTTDFGKQHGATLEVKNEPYKLSNYLWQPGKGAGNAIKNLVYPNRTIVADLLWGMAFPPFTFIIPAVGIVRALVKANKAKKEAASNTESIPANTPPTSTPDDITAASTNTEPTVEPPADTSTDTATDTKANTDKKVTTTKPLKLG